MNAIVVSGSNGYLDGQIVEGPHNVTRAVNHGAILLPIDEDFDDAGPLDGYFKRSWGHGWLFDGNKSERGCPMALRITPGKQYVHWVARVVPHTEGRHEYSAGMFRLIGDSTQFFLSTGLVAEHTPNTFEMFATRDEMEGVVMRGVSRITTSEPGIMGFCLYAVASKLKVMWSAVSVCSNSE